MGLCPRSPDGVIGSAGGPSRPARSSSAGPVAAIAKYVMENGLCCGASYKEFASGFPAWNQDACVSCFTERASRDAAPQQAPMRAEVVSAAADNRKRGRSASCAWVFRPCPDFRRHVIREGVLEASENPWRRPVADCIFACRQIERIFVEAIVIIIVAMVDGNERCGFHVLPSALDAERASTMSSCA